MPRVAGCGMRVVRAPADADRWIIDFIQASEDPGAWSVATSDRALGQAVRDHGAGVVGASRVWAWLDELEALNGP